MKSRSLFIFSLVTIVIVIAASVSISSRYGGTTQGLANKAVFEGFSKKFEDVEIISVQDRDKTLTVRRSDDTWVMVDRSNYRASPEAVRNVLLGLAELRLKEPKTERKKLYSRLQVEDLSEKEAKSQLLMVKGKNGDTLAALIVGRETSEIAGASDVGRYIRKPDETISWLAEGRLQLPDGVNKWVMPQFMHVDSKRVDTVMVVHPSGQVMQVKRENPKSTKFIIENFPTGREIEYQSDLDNMAEGLDKLELQDVRKAEDIKFPKEKTIKTKYRMFDGLIVNIETFEDSSGKFWGRLTSVSDGTAKSEVKNEVREINSSVSKWVYELPAHKFRYMSRKLEDVLKQPKKPGKQK